MGSPGHGFSKLYQSTAVVPHNEGRANIQPDVFGQLQQCTRRDGSATGVHSCSAGLGSIRSLNHNPWGGGYVI